MSKGVPKAAVVVTEITDDPEPTYRLHGF